MSRPYISVVIPCFNAAETLAETIASVLEQTMQDFEILAVDNNSSDTTLEILSELAFEEPRLRILHQPIQGPSATRNLGIRDARGTLVAFLDADDLWDREYLEVHATNLGEDRVGVSYARARLMYFDGRPTGQVSRPKLTGIQAADILRSNPCTSTSFIVVPRRVFDGVGPFNEDLHRGEDQEWLFRAACAGFPFLGIDRVLASYRITPGSLSSDIEGMLAGHTRMLDAAEAASPDLMAKERRLAHAAMLRYCARRAMDHDNTGGVARTYLYRMLRVAPDLVLREPLTTIKTLVAVLCPGIAGTLLRWRRALQSVEA